MANNASVNVENVFSDSVTINVQRMLQDGSVDLNVTIPQNEARQINLPNTDVKLVIAAPQGMDLCNCNLKVQTDVDLDNNYSRTDGTWTLQIIPNNLPPDVPTTVNVTVGQEDPD